MISLPIGALMFGWVMFQSMHGANLKVFLNEHSIILVIVGTIAILGLSTPIRIIQEILKTLLHAGGGIDSKARINKQLLDLVVNREVKLQKPHPMMVTAQRLWESGVEFDVFNTLITRSLDENNKKSEQAVAAIKNLAKYPPALGMIGTVIGMVSLFGSLGGDNKDTIGPSLANAMTATFFGLILANAIISPLGDRLSVHHMAMVELNEHVFRVLGLINQKYPQALLEEELKHA